MPAKQYEVLRNFRMTNRRSGAASHHEAGSLYSGPLDNEYLLDPQGPDGKGPLIAEKASPAAEKSTPVAPSASDSKENK